MNNYSEFLKDLEYFQQMDAKEILLVDQVCKLEKYDKGQVIIAEDGLKEKFYIIYEGAVHVFKNYGRADQGLLAELTRGNMFGELSLIDGLPRSATVVTSAPSELLAIDRRDFGRLLSESATMAFSIMRWISAMIRRFNKNFVDTVQQRNRELERSNLLLEKEIGIRKEKERQLNIYQSRLEEKVFARTKALQKSNEKLKREIAFRRKTEAEKEKTLFKLENTVMKVKTLSGLFPVCIKCRKVRSGTGYWQQLDQYIQEHSEAEFRESICEECTAKYYPNFYK